VGWLPGRPAQKFFSVGASFICLLFRLALCRGSLQAAFDNTLSEHLNIFPIKKQYGQHLHAFQLGMASKESCG